MIKFLIGLLIFGIVIIEFMGFITGGLRFSRFTMYSVVVIIIIGFYVYKNIFKDEEVDNED